jgi:hypothetical protein
MIKKDYVLLYKRITKLMTGHANGVILFLREADSALREQMRKQFLEPYRTLIGHLRHEVDTFLGSINL